MTRDAWAAQILELWDRGVDRGWIDRALSLLEMSEGEGREVLAALPISERDARLGALRRRLFGAEVGLLCECPACHETMEATADLDTMGLARARSASTGVVVVVHDGVELHLRPPTSLDLDAVMTAPDAESAGRALLARCVRAVSSEGAVLATESLGASALEAASREMSRVDPRSRIELEVACAACGHAWAAPFDIVSFLWREVEANARRLMHEVHVLARAYGWSEPDVLSLSAHRRDAYLRMVQA